MINSNKIKRLVIIFVSLMSLIYLVGCNVSQEKIKIDFIIYGQSHLVGINKGASINKKIIPLDNIEEVEGLYYDENMENKYENEPLNEDTKMYVKTDTKISEDVMKKIKTKYVSEYLLKYNENANIDEVYIDNFYGVYNNAYVLIITNDYVEYLAVITDEVIGGYRFKYPNNNVIKVFYEDSFYTLTSAYLNKILSDEDISHIYEKFNK